MNSRKKLFLRLLAVFTAIAVSFGFVPAITASAEGEGVEINETNFPDETFRTYVSNEFDSDSNGSLSDEEIGAVTYLYVGSTNISSLQGIEYFTELEIIECTDNELTSLNLGKNTSLEYLWCGSNQLTSLDVSNNTALKTLDCRDNQLTSIDVSNNTALKEVSCSGNQLTSLDFGKNTSLEYLSCGSNQLTSLNVSNNTALKTLDCRDNQLTSLDVSNNTALEDLFVINNQLTSLDVSSNSELAALLCGNNQLTSLDISNNPNLWVLACLDNQLTSLDLSNNTALQALSCRDNQLTDLDVTNNTELFELDCRNNQLTALDLKNNENLISLDCSGNQLTSLDLSNNLDVTFEIRRACVVLNESSIKDNKQVITIDEKTRTFDLSTLEGDFDVNMASDWVGGTVNGTILTVDEGAEEVTYTYNTGLRDISDTFTLIIKEADHVHTAGRAVRENEVKATTSAEGSYEEVIYCMECGEEVSRETKVIEKLTETEEKTDENKTNTSGNKTTENKTETKSETSTPNTADHSNTGLWGMILLASAGLLAVVVSRRRLYTK